MVGTNLKVETTALMDKRSSIEAGMDAVIDRLCNGQENFSEERLPERKLIGCKEMGEEVMKSVESL